MPEFVIFCPYMCSRNPVSRETDLRGNYLFLTFRQILPLMTVCVLTAGRGLLTDSEGLAPDRGA